MGWRRGSISRRHFMGIAGLGTAAAVMGRLYPEFGLRAAWAEDLGTQMAIATWPNYHDPETFVRFKDATGVAVEVNVFGSNEEMFAKLQAGGAGWALFVPTNYAVSTYAGLGLIDPLDLSKLPNFSAEAQTPRFTEEGAVDGKTYALPKNWGTTGMAVNTDKMETPVTSLEGVLRRRDGSRPTGAPWCTTIS